MPLSEARKLVGDDAVIGISVSNEDEVKEAIEGGADYVGIGAVWDTSSKDVSKKIKLAPSGVGKLLDILAGRGLQSVAIGEYMMPLS